MDAEEPGKPVHLEASDPERAHTAHWGNVKRVRCLCCATRRGCYIICSDFPLFVTSSLNLMEGWGQGQGSAGWIRTVSFLISVILFLMKDYGV